VAGRANHKTGDTLGRWTLIWYIKSGGNGDVWRAEAARGETAALKILHCDSPVDYARFRREVSICQQVDPADVAILPVLDAYLPETPSRSERPWFAMPLATNLADALKEAPLAAKVVAVRDAATTLARLLAERGVHHRDVKPANLYIYNGRPVVGDFGLAKRPDDTDLSGDRPIGAFHHYPSEVIAGDGQPDWERVDVHCLANTLWCLAVEKPRPPRGLIRAEGEYSLGRVSEAGSQHLAALIEGATAETPAARPTLHEFAMHLDAWLAAQDASDDFATDYERSERNKLTVLRWLVASVRDEPWFDSGGYDTRDLDTASPIPGLTERDVGEALSELIEEGMIFGEPQLVLGRREPIHFSRLYPSLAGICRVESLGVLLAQAAPLLRAFVTPADMISLPRSAQPIELHGDVSRTPPEAHFQMMLLAEKGLLDFNRLRESGGGATLTNIRTTSNGKRWLYESSGSRQ